MPGALLDTDPLDPAEPYPATKKPIAVTLKNAYIQVLAAQTTGHWDGAAFTDQTSAQFAAVAAGDVVTVVPSSA